MHILDFPPSLHLMKLLLLKTLRQFIMLSSVTTIIPCYFSLVRYTQKWPVGDNLEVSRISKIYPAVEENKFSKEHDLPTGRIHACSLNVKEWKGTLWRAMWRTTLFRVVFHSFRLKFASFWVIFNSVLEWNPFKRVK